MGHKVWQFVGKDEIFWLMIFVPGLEKLFLGKNFDNIPAGKFYVVGWLGNTDKSKVRELQSLWSIHESDPYFEELQGLGKLAASIINTKSCIQI